MSVSEGAGGQTLDSGVPSGGAPSHSSEPGSADGDAGLGQTEMELDDGAGQGGAAGGNTQSDAAVSDETSDAGSGGTFSIPSNEDAGTTQGTDTDGGDGGLQEAAEPPSCADLAASCGPTGSTSCCDSQAIPAGNIGEVRFNSYRLDTYEVTVGRYRNFIAAYEAGWRPETGSGAHPDHPLEDAGWDDGWDLATGIERSLDCVDSDLFYGLKPWCTPSSEALPVNYIDWHVAFAFCVWDGGRLPPKSEWIYAAQGGEARYFPWSTGPEDQTFTPDHAISLCGEDAVCSIEDLLVPGSKPAGNARWGHADMAGNLWEWTRDRTGGSDSLGRANMHGGGYMDYPDVMKTISSLGENTDSGLYRVGIRCARDTE